MAPTVPILFQPANVGSLQLKHRVVLAPLTRFRSSDPGHVPILPMMKEYYSQRASTPGTLLIAEATFIAARAGGYAHVPGIWSEEQISAWKEITDSALGRAANPKQLRKEDASFPYVSASDVKMESAKETPRAMTGPEIQEYAGLYVQAAKNALRAGFDGVEIHGSSPTPRSCTGSTESIFPAANGYLIDQFIQDVSNKRTDEYGGSIENRARFALQVVDAVTEAIGADRTGIRLSPWSTFQDMGMRDPKPTFAYLVSQIKALHPDFAYIHLVEPRISGGNDDNTGDDRDASNNFLRVLWAPKTLISAGGYSRETALQRAEKDGDIIAFGRQFLANPDLPVRLMKGIPTNEPDRKTFYLPASAKGYTDYPFAREFAAKA
ncbi:hypothetical protein DFH07DRAFT_869171 [Mycena maculata]|uniref:NADH:flavin oxidoreductase/NADH oxidase N-terminal domain-containing protein n=1 Tax=Mycena maculata TaxID=230809 RepID=A0AAD7N895_9AGAR|nr:hypothetical protein DFH07DRAFT_869171 [Mycena maculata]